MRNAAIPGTRLRKSARRDQILLELKLRQHVRISELASRFGVSTETVRRDIEELSDEGLASRAHGGASVPHPGRYPDLDERRGARIAERGRIGMLAATLVEPGDTVMIDSGSTTLQAARFLAVAGTPCTVLTNSLPVAVALGQSAAAAIILCPGRYLASEAAVVGTDAVEYLSRHSVSRCMIGASGLSASGPSEDIRGFAAIKRAMIARSGRAHLLIDARKFGHEGLARVGPLAGFASVVTDRAPDGALGTALDRAGVEVLVAA